MIHIDSPQLASLLTFIEHHQPPWATIIIQVAYPWFAGVLIDMHQLLQYGELGHNQP